jgi:pyridoxal phosphate enzyme (YggS family)
MASGEVRIRPASAYDRRVTVAEGIDRVRERIDAACSRYGHADDVTLELAAKTRTPETCREAARALAERGLPVVLGHNRVQEALSTAPAIREVPGASIHLIGPLQKNKINHALNCVDLVETVASRELVEELDIRASRNCMKLQVFLQVNTSGEPSKHGCSPEDVPSLVEAVELSPSLRLEGFMTVGLHSDDEAAVRRSYMRLRELRDDAAERLAVAESDLQLSMGMSQDLEWAIAEGATVVRVGTAVFGPRPAIG